MGERKTILEFPCSFPLKVMGRNADDFEAFIVALVQKHVPDFTGESVSTRKSNGSRYLSVTVTFVAESQEQLDAIYRELSAHERVLMAL